MTLIPLMVQPMPEMSSTGKPTFTLYTCPMSQHVDVVSDKPGKCPKCQMELVETAKVKHGKIAEENWRKQHADHQH